MQIRLLAVGDRMPAWVKQGYEEYAKRMPRECRLSLHEIAPVKRGRNADLERICSDEGERLLASISRGQHVVALEIGGKAWSTEALSRELTGWLNQGRDVALLIGGPEGLSRACRERADQLWSLSPLTLPHPLVRIVVAEQIYRAWSLIHHHPYHR
jgi:23S rRNA (pseudouridine1915-N3)-methyltransferase